jgi:hypothetical protein
MVLAESARQAMAFIKIINGIGFGTEAERSLEHGARRCVADLIRLINVLAGRLERVDRYDYA